MNKQELETNKTDIIVAGVTSTVGIIPFVGGVLSEVIRNTVPKQREDRIVKFISEMSDQLNLSLQDLEKKFSDLKYCNFTYCTLKGVCDEVYEEKIKYYKKLLIESIEGDSLNLIHNERILKILIDLDYYEIQYLRFYSDCNLGGTSTMDDVISKIGFSVLQPSYYLSMEESKMDEETYKQITLNNLCAAGLLEKETKLLGKKTRVNYKITLLGKLILKKIGADINE